MSRVRTTSAFVSPLLIAVLWPAAASSVVVDQGVIEETIAGTEAAFCGVEDLTVTHEGTLSLRYRAVPHGKDGPAYYVSNGHVQETITAAGGKYVTVEDRVTEKDQVVTENPDGTLTILILATGSSKVRDMAGRLIAANPGQVRFEMFLDANGEEFLDRVIVKESTGRTDDFCAAVVPALT